MLQFLDKTKDVMLQKHIADNKFLQIINAFVSHELRNPLNSITSQNNQKIALMDELRAMHRDANLTLEEIKVKTEPILNQLMESVRVQESAADIMRFIVQDLLDYAQIKEGKFRKNVKVFDVREAVQTVMKIQRDKALNNGISLECKFENLHDGDIEEADPGQIL